MAHNESTIAGSSSALITSANRKKEVRTGKLSYSLTNDYLFKAFLQENETALRGLLCALLDLKSKEIRTVSITNPIELGKSLGEKTCVLDMKLILNSDKVINLEMQVKDAGDWPLRSLTYLCRAFDHLKIGEDYNQARQTIHIGILNFSPKHLAKHFHTKYMFCDTKTHEIYSDKLVIHMLNLTQLDDLSEEEKKSDLYCWARLFKAKTWEEINMLSEKNEEIKSGIVTLKKLTQSEKIRMECEAREDYYRREKSVRNMGREQGEERVNSLNRKLEETGRTDDIIRAATDIAYQKKLFEEFGL